MFNHGMLEKLMAKAYSHALDSPDPSSQVGSVLCKRASNGQIDVVAKGYNHFYKGVPPEVEDREKKLQRICHAERDCIYYAASRGISTQGSILICSWIPCHGCARAIIGAEVGALVYHKQRKDLTDERWLSKLNEAMIWLQDAGVWLYEFDGPVPGTKPILVSGRLWSPGSCDYV
jgi:deoxycytidylate deaminase